MQKITMMLSLSATLWFGPACAQNFDGTWTGSTGCPAYGSQAAYTEPATATISQNQFRLERRTAYLYEMDQGAVGANGFVSAGGEGQRRDRPLNWAAQFSGHASATTMKLTGTRYMGRPCWVQLTNTQPAPYSLAGIEATKLAARAEAEREVVTENRTTAAPKATYKPLQQPKVQLVDASKPEQINAESIQVEELRRTTNFLLEIKEADAQVLSPSETPAQLANFGTGWQSPTRMGAVKIFLPRPNLTGLSLISELTDSESKRCKGEFTSGRWSGLVDSEVVFQANTECVQSTTDRKAKYYIAPREKGGFYAYLILLVAQPQNKQTTTTQTEGEEQQDIYRKAALVASTDQKD